MFILGLIAWMLTAHTKSINIITTRSMVRRLKYKGHRIIGAVRERKAKDTLYYTIFGQATSSGMLIINIIVFLLTIPCINLNGMVPAILLLQLLMMIDDNMLYRTISFVLLAIIAKK